jgi:uncharacterized sulfatase
MTHKHLGRLKSLLFICILWTGCSSGQRPPNIILILGDDHGYQDFGFMGSSLVITPRLDRLAREGVAFTRGFNSSNECRRSQRSLLTGLHPDQWDARIEALRREGIERTNFYEIVDLVTLPRLLSEKGYVSFQGGKYWEGTYHNASFTHGMKGSIGPEVRAKYRGMLTAAGADGLKLGRKTMDPLWDFLDAHHDRPFYVWFAPMLPHIPHDAGPEHLRLYEGKGLSEPAQKYYANISRFDDLVGQLLDYLGRHNLREKTLLIYLSDNGWDQGPHEAIDRPRIKKGKFSMYELAFRTPIIFSWPGHIAQGTRYDYLVSSVDLFSTCLDFVGIEPLSDRSGMSLYPLLTGKGGFSRQVVIGSAMRRRKLPPELAGDGPGESHVQERAFFLRDKRWHYIWYHEREDELYSIEDDPRETQNLANQYPELVKQLRQQIEGWLELQTAAYRKP